MPRGIGGHWERLTACAFCETPKKQHRKDQKLRPGRFPCLDGGSHKFSVWVPGDNPDCKRCSTGRDRHTCQDVAN
ncbi:hypothetical protein SEA_MAMAPEARL_28 [Arthrobacter phage MamaPearl]|uniref:Uncharacterized protein n=1 Tax=Arthrobacter phage MamaPearl TaxID=2743906 RepID=A0AAE7F7F4_9CAUD|nr:hypothetical protein KDJ03_gp28 [Arthrobacter phage MamaPearl]QDH48216.1 hypothetical protein SEA_ESTEBANJULIOR_28 [Arthrobacter phage EstebanJulior]QKY79098.1 hypothetical protein SEA_MAMAPEARL_28 [Arthrobacter phage MamaPearl]